VGVCVGTAGQGRQCAGRNEQTQAYKGDRALPKTRRGESFHDESPNRQAGEKGDIGFLVIA
jgi:hypothetical protein